MEISLTSSSLGVCAVISWEGEDECTLEGRLKSEFGDTLWVTWWNGYLVNLINNKFTWLKVNWVDNQEEKEENKRSGKGGVFIKYKWVELQLERQQIIIITRVWYCSQFFPSFFSWLVKTPLKQTEETRNDSSIRCSTGWLMTIPVKGAN